MNRLTAAMRWDIQLQFRYGFYYAGAFVAVVNIILLTQLFNAGGVAIALPLLAMLGITITTFYFVAGLVLFEKAENVLEGLVVTPLRVGEYLSAKAATLTFVSLLEMLLMTLVSHGFGFNWPLFLLGCVLMGVIGTFLGFWSVSRYDSINQYLFPSVLVMLPLQLPVFHYFGLVDGWLGGLFYLIPSQAPLMLLEAAFRTLPTWEVVYGVVYSLVWVGVSYYLARRAHYQFIVRQQGVR